VGRVSREQRGLLDTSVVIDLDEIEPTLLPIEISISTITIAELAAGPHATNDMNERAKRQDRLQRAEAAFIPVAFTQESARAYGLLYAATLTAGKQPRPRIADLFIAASACSLNIPLYTRNIKDFIFLDKFLRVISI
jgi:predicted nucleic acid-binding protein